MASIATLLDLQNEFSAALNDMTQSLHSAVQPLDNITQSLNNVMQSLSNIASGLARVQINSPPNPNPNQNQNQRNADGGSNQGNAGSSDKKKKGIGDKVKGAVTKNLSMENVGKVLKLSDQYAETSARMGMMNDNLQSTQDLMNMVHAAAQDSRSSFNDMAAAVIGFGTNSGNAFDSSAEIVTFADLMKKQMAIAGMSATDTSKAMQSLSKGLSDGVISGEELSSIFGEAPNMVQNIAEYLGVSTDQVTKMAAAGNLTADIVKNAVFSASDEINEKFRELPMTWAQVGQSIENTALKVFAPVLQMINNLANSAGFQSLVTGAMAAISVLASAVTGIFEIMSAVGGFIVDNWSAILPIILGVIAALIVYNAVMGIGWLTALKDIGVKAKQAIVSGAQATATFLQTAAQQGLNAAIAACPVTWLIIAIIALIAIIFAVCSAIAKATGIAQSGFGVICGAVMAAAAFILNLAIGIINAVIQCFWNMFVTPFLSIIEWILNVVNGGFDSFGGAVANLIGNIISWFLSLGKVVTKIIDAIFGTDWTSGLTSLQDEVLSWGKNDNAITLDRTAPAIDGRFDYGTAFAAGAEWGDGVSSKVSGFFEGFLGGNELPDGKDFLGEYDYSSILDNSGMAEDLNSISGNTDNISDALDVSQEDLKYLRDIAEQEAVNRFTTAEVTINQTNNNNIASDMDLDGVLNGLDNAMGEAIDIMTEGAHA